ncbi:MAG: pyridoxine 5'-phosphate synthase [Muribaculaceae bacterium]|nr:pyridoxine 5'-phosphate synthase [Muribaculaceae bacterium]
MTRLSVNINKVATLRNARGENAPDIVEFALAAERAGAQGITVHPRPDERHITRADVYELRRVITTEFNIEGYPSPEFLKLVLEVKPEQVTLVPDAPDAITSSAGWDVIGRQDFLAPIVERLHSAAIRTSIFVDPDPAQVKEAARIGADRVELYTKPYADMFPLDPDKAVEAYIPAAKAAVDSGIGLNAGHDLNTHNLNFLYRRLPRLDEVSIGHALISDCLYWGLDETVRKYLKCLMPNH